MWGGPGARQWQKGERTFREGLKIGLLFSACVIHARWGMAAKGSAGQVGIKPDVGSAERRRRSPDDRMCASDIQHKFAGF